MKDIDIIKGIQFVGDDLISRAEDCSPIRRRSVKGYIAAAACLLLVTAAIPIVIAHMNHGGFFASSTERLDADEYGRTFYDMWLNSKDDYTVENYAEGTVLFSSSLKELLEDFPHEEQDCFAVTVKDLLGADLNKVHEKFTVKYDENDIAKNDQVCPTIYVTEKQLRSMEPVEDMCLYIDSVKHEPYYEQYYYCEEINSLANEKFSKFYGEIELNYDAEDAMRALGLNPDETSSQDSAVLDELERYYRKFAADYGIDPDKLYAGGVRRTLYWNTGLASNNPNYISAHPFTDITLYGEFETAVAERMTRDKRVNNILKTSNNSYIYEERGLWSYPTMVSEEKISEIPAGTPYGEIVEALGHTAQYGYNSLHVYLADPGEAAIAEEYGLIILDFDDPNELCPYSGDELLRNAVYLENLDNARFAEPDLFRNANAAVLKDDLALVLYKDRIRPVRIGFGDVITNEITGFDPHRSENGDLVRYEARSADKSEVFRTGTKLCVTRLNALDNFELYYDCISPIDFDVKSIVILP